MVEPSYFMYCDNCRILEHESISQTKICPQCGFVKYQVTIHGDTDLVIEHESRINTLSNETHDLNERIVILEAKCAEK